MHKLKLKTRITAILILTSLIIALGNTFLRGYEPAHLEVHFIDVGQGDCELIIGEMGKTMLIDSGVEKMSDKVIGYISSLGIKKLDYVVATHPDSDHIGAMDKIVEHFDVDHFFMPTAVSKSSDYKELISVLGKKNLPPKALYSGDELQFDNANMKVLSPRMDKNYNDTNSYSIVIKLIYQNTSFMFTGDATMENESDIVDDFDDISCDVLKLAHHGSSTSTSEYFLKRANPTFAVISCGKNNKYRHPSKVVTKLLKKYETGIFRTDYQGSIVLKVKDHKLYSNTDPIYEYE